MEINLGGVNAMYVLTADQIDSTHTADLAGAAVAEINAEYGSQLALPADRNAGDEIQVMVEDAAVAVALALRLLRTSNWSVGLGVGAVRTPLPANTREAAGPAFVAARSAVGLAKKAAYRFALTIDGDDRNDLAALFDLLLFARSKRTAEGWEIYDLLARGLSQTEAAGALGITAQAASRRAQVGGVRAELAAIPALARLLGEADGVASVSGIRQTGSQ